METNAIEQRPGAGTAVKLLIGCFVTALGILLTLDNLDVMESERYLGWWPLLLIAIGIIGLVSGGSRVISIGLVVVGLWLTAYNVGVIDFTLFDLWPLILIVVGIGFVARAFGWNPDPPEIGSSTMLGILSVRKVTETSRDFRGRRYVAFLGGCEVDFTGADIVNGPAIIETFAVWGGIEIVVPDGWEVVGEVVPVMAGFEVKVRPGSGPGRQLIVRGAAVMGGVDIKSAPARRS